MKQAKFPPGWDEKTIQEIIAHYENQTEAEAVTEAEAAFSDPSSAVMVIPHELVPLVEALIAKHQATKRGPSKTTKKRKRA